MTTIKKLAAAAAFALCALAPAAALANVLFLSTGTETESPYNTSMGNIKTSLGAKMTRDGTDWLTTKKIEEADFEGIEVVVIATGKNQDIKAENLKPDSTLAKKMSDPNLAFLIFSDGCSSANCQNNLAQIAKLVGDAAGMSLTVGSKLNSNSYGNVSAALNSGSQYNSHFTVLSSIKLDRYSRIKSPKKENLLYDATGDEAAAIFLPATQTGGACIFMAGELTMWKNGFGQQTALMNLFDKVKPGSAACTDAPPKPTVLYLSTAEWHQNGQNGCLTYPTEDNGGGAHFIFGTFKDGDFTNGKRQSTGSLLALYDEVGDDNMIARPGVLSNDTQIEKAQLFKGTTEVQYPGLYPGKTTSAPLTLFNAKDRKDRTDNCESAGTCADWQDAMQQLDALPKNSVVVVQSGYQLIDPAKAKTLLEKMSTRKDLAFVLLLDTCVACSYDGATCPDYDKHKENKGSLANLNYFMEGTGITAPAYSINSATGWQLRYEHLGNSLNVTNMKSDLSGYKGVIGLDKLQGHTTGALECVPKQNVIFQSATPKGSIYYTFPEKSGYYCASSNYKDDENFCTRPDSGSYAASWPELNESSAYGLLIPFWQNNKGQGGACIYLGVDNNIFDRGREKGRDGGCTTTNPCPDNETYYNKGAQHLEIAKMFASLPTGACAIRNGETTAGVCDDTVMKSACYKCVLEDATSGPGNAVLKTEDVASSEICTAKSWKAVCENHDKCACPAGVIEDDYDNCCVCAHAKASTSSGSLCCDINETPVGDPGSQTCCPTDNIAHEGSETGAEICCGTGNIIPSGGVNVCCPVGQAVVDGACCPSGNIAHDGSDTAANTCCGTGNIQPSDKTPGANVCCPVGQAVVGGACCATPAHDGSETGAEICCTTGNIKHSGGVDVCCAAGEIIKGGVCVTPPTPKGGAAVPTTGWLALLGLGALLPLLARRQSRQSKRRDEDGDA